MIIWSSTRWFKLAIKGLGVANFVVLGWEFFARLVLAGYCFCLG